VVVKEKRYIPLLYNHKKKKKNPKKRDCNPNNSITINNENTRIPWQMRERINTICASKYLNHSFCSLPQKINIFYVSITSVISLSFLIIYLDRLYILIYILFTHEDTSSISKVIKWMFKSYIIWLELLSMLHVYVSLIIKSEKVLNNCSSNGYGKMVNWCGWVSNLIILIEL